MLAGIPLTSVQRVAGAIFYAATDPDESSNGSAWLLADDGEVFMVPKEEFKLGVYAMLDRRVNGIRACVSLLSEIARTDNCPLQCCNKYQCVACFHPRYLPYFCQTRPYCGISRGGCEGCLGP
jgi:hypothetical protein